MSTEGLNPCIIWVIQNMPLPTSQIDVFAEEIALVLRDEARAAVPYPAGAIRENSVITGIRSLRRSNSLTTQYHLEQTPPQESGTWRNISAGDQCGAFR